MKIAVENLIPYTNRGDLGEGAYFNLCETDTEMRLASYLAILLMRNAGCAKEIYRDYNQVGISSENGKEFRIIVVQVR
jgi:hypothetical protein